MGFGGASPGVSSANAAARAGGTSLSGPAAPTECFVTGHLLPGRAAQRQCVRRQTLGLESASPTLES